METLDRRILTSEAGAELVTPPIMGNVTNPDATGTPAEIWAQAQAAPETYDDAAWFDSRLRMDVNSIKSFCARGQADVIAVADGNWSSASTWYNTDSLTQVKPVAGDRILIPQGITVTYDEDSDIEYAQLRIDGVFDTDTTGNRKLVVDTIFVDHTGAFEIASEASPFPAQYRFEIVYPDNGDLSPVNDPFLMQRGFVCFGRSHIYGAPKLAFGRTTAGLAQGATSLTLDRAVTGWNVGDEILITGTRYRQFMPANWIPPEEETRIITAIDNTDPNAPVISWSGGLTYPHPACFRRAAWTPHVANLTRNIKTYTAGANPLNKHRAHQLFKNKDTNAVYYVEARKMGRTDMGPDGNGKYRVPVDLMAYVTGGGTITADTNTTGRYPWHFHRNGPDDPTLDPTVFEGLVMVDNAAWGYVHHDSHGIMRHCIAYDFQGGGFVGEGGASFGEISDCLSAHCREPEISYSSATIKDGGHHKATLGHGFWFNSRVLHSKRNVACGVQAGIVWTTRPKFELNTYPGTTKDIRAFYGLVADPTTQVDKQFSVIEGFENNEAYACKFGGGVVKSGPNQHHSSQAFLDGFKAWEVLRGFHLQYTAGYTLKDFELVGFNAANRTHHDPEAGIEIYRRTAQITVLDPIIENFDKGITYTKFGGFSTDDYMNNHVVNSSFPADIAKPYYILPSPDDPVAEEITLPYSRHGGGVVDVQYHASSAIASPGPIVPGYDEDQCYWDGENHFVIADTFTLTDRLGTRTRYAGQVDPDQVDGGGFRVRVNNQILAKNAALKTTRYGVLVIITRQQMELMMKAEGVWTSRAGDKVLLIPDVADDRIDGKTTHFYTPVALRMPLSQYFIINPPENGILGQHSMPPTSGAYTLPEPQDFTHFQPAGTVGLT